MSKLALTAALVLASISLTGCAPSETLACEKATGGEQVESVTVSGEDGAPPTVSFPSPITVEGIQSKVLIEGEGPVFTGTNLIEFEFAGYNGGTGALLQQSNFDGVETPAGVFGPERVPNFCSALVGAKEGSRIVTILSAMEAHGGVGSPDFGISPTDSYVFVFDIKKVYLDKAKGQAQAAQSGFPSVVTTPEGIPGITIPKTAPPTELKIATLIQGEGDEVAAGETVVLHYSGFLWSDGTKFDSSWDTGQPTQFEFVEGGLIEGFLDAVIGQKVGSQVIAVIPPEFGYGDVDAGSIPAGSTLIFVIDILGISD